MLYREKEGRGPSPCSMANLLPLGSQAKSTTLSALLGSSNTCQSESRLVIPGMYDMILSPDLSSMGGADIQELSRFECWSALKLIAKR